MYLETRAETKSSSNKDARDGGLGRGDNCIFRVSRQLGATLQNCQVASIAAGGATSERRSYVRPQLAGRRVSDKSSDDDERAEYKSVHSENCFGLAFYHGEAE